MGSDYHIPVLLNDVIEGLCVRGDGRYVDVTYGGGGHSKEILSRLTTGRLYAFDQDQDAEDNVLEDERLVFSRTNFRYFSQVLRLNGIREVDGVLADLGVSSHQFDVPERGFSFREAGPLDMRMVGSGSGLTAAQILNEYEEEGLTRVFRDYGELKGAFRLSQRIVSDRSETPFSTTHELVGVCDKVFGGKQRNKVLAQVFQALRIEVNQELEVLKVFLQSAAEVLKVGGRLVVISYHSLEDRLVKNYLKRGSFDGSMEKDFYGNVVKPFEEVNRKVIVPTEEEIVSNPRARSARLRIAEKK